MITGTIAALAIALFIGGARKSLKANKIYQESWTGIAMMFVGLIGIFGAAVSIFIW